MNRQPGATPNMGELRSLHVKAGFAPRIDEALRHHPGLLQAVATRVLDTCFPATLHADIAALAGLDLEGPVSLTAGEAPAAYDTKRQQRRDPAFRERVLRAYEYRCCVCGFDLRIGHLPAGLEAAHIQWHHTGGPDVEANGLLLCALHHKLFDLGAFTIEPAVLRIVYSEHAISGDRSVSTELKHHGQAIHTPRYPEQQPAAEYLAWNVSNVFKTPSRRVAKAS